jgi:hypothetical protein
LLKLDISFDGSAAALEGSLKRMRAQVKDRLPLMKMIGIALRATYIKSMNIGVDPEGRPLPPTQGWTRALGVGAGARRANKKMIPLVNTGMLRNSMGTVSVSKDHLEFGWKGPQLAKAARMINGTPGRMLVKEKFIRTGRNGQYARAQTDSGWITKKVSGGSVKITPQKRNFFYMSNRQMKVLSDRVDGWVNDIVAERKAAGA